MPPRLGFTVRFLRMKLGLSQRALAEKVGVTGPYIAMLERGARKNPSFALLKRMAKALGVPVTDLWADNLASLGESPARLRDRLEPFWEDVDGLVDGELKAVLPPEQYLRFDACRTKMKALWYRRSRVAELDEQYGHVVDDLRSQRSAVDRLPRNGDGSRSYRPFSEAMEFEDLLDQAKACLDTFSLGVGMVSRGSTSLADVPSNLSALANALRQRRKAGQAVADLLSRIEQAEGRLKGLVLDPGDKGQTNPDRRKKSLRDLIAHREGACIEFRISEGGRSAGALLRDHPQIVRQSNRRVTAIADEIWHQTSSLVREALPHVLRMAQERRQTHGRGEEEGR